MKAFEKRRVARTQTMLLIAGRFFMLAKCWKKPEIETPIRKTPLCHLPFVFD
jgi:hypothetical protein